MLTRPDGSYAEHATSGLYCPLGWIVKTLSGQVMKRTLLYLYLALVFVWRGQAFAQGVVVEYFPIHVGDKWIYGHETRDDNGRGIAHLEIHQWKTEETTIGPWPVPEGMLVARQVRIIEGSPPPDWVHPEQERGYLIRDNCLYADVSWNPATRQVAPDFLKGLGAYLSPDFCFPLVMHKTWGAPHGLPDWEVSRPEEAKDWRVVGIEVRDKQETFHITSISSYPGSGMTVDIWFIKGVGIVREEEIHHGTIGEERTRLLRFESASPR